MRGLFIRWGLAATFIALTASLPVIVPLPCVGVFGWRVVLPLIVRWVWIAFIPLVLIAGRVAVIAGTLTPKIAILFGGRIRGLCRRRDVGTRRRNAGRVGR